MSYKKALWFLIIISFLIRIILASFTELGNDEAYYWTYSQHLQWNYFDHPPMVAIWIRIFTCNLWFQQYELFVRLGSLASCAACTWIMFQLGAKLHSEKAGFFIACLYNTSLYASIIAGVFIMPDSPQILFWCLSLFLLQRIFINDKNWLNWMLFAVSTGFCILSKVHGIFIWSGLIFFILFYKRQWLKLPQLYIAFAVTAAIASPILFWNIANDFITYKFHSERIAVDSFTVNVHSFFTELFGEILYNNPLNVVLAGIAIAGGLKIKKLKNKIFALYSCIALPMIFIILIISLFRDTLPHWSGPAYITLLPLTGIYLASQKSKKRISPVIKFAFILIIFFASAGFLLINSYPGTIGDKAAEKFGDGDFTLDMNGWKNAGLQFQKIYFKDVQDNIMPVSANMVCYKWFPAAHEQYYFCKPIGMQMIGLGQPFDLHEYLWYNRLNANAGMNKSYCVVPSNESYNVKQVYAAYYADIDFAAEIKSYRNTNLSRIFYVYRLSGWKGKVPMQ